MTGNGKTFTTGEILDGSTVYVKVNGVPDLGDTGKPWLKITLPSQATQSSLFGSAMDPTQIVGLLKSESSSVTKVDTAPVAGDSDNRVSSGNRLGEGIRQAAGGDYGKHSADARNGHIVIACLLLGGCPGPITPVLVCYDDQESAFNHSQRN